MKVNSTVVLTLILLTLMFGAGIISAAWGFTLGREALKGVSQPDVSPASSLPNRKPLQQTSSDKVPVAILREEDILATVKARIEGSAKEAAQKKSGN